MAGPRQACDRATKRPLHAVVAALPIRLACGGRGRGRQIVRTVRPVHARDLSRGGAVMKLSELSGWSRDSRTVRFVLLAAHTGRNQLSSDEATSWGFELMADCIVICEKEGWSCGVS